MVWVRASLSMVGVVLVVVVGPSILLQVKKGFGIQSCRKGILVWVSTGISVMGVVLVVVVGPSVLLQKHIKDIKLKIEV